MFVCCECCVLSSRGLRYGLITRPEKSYRLWRVAVCDQETSKTLSGCENTTTMGCNARTTNKQTNKQTNNPIRLITAPRWCYLLWFMQRFWSSSSHACSTESQWLRVLCWSYHMTAYLLSIPYFVVRLHNIYPAPFEVLSGVPQGSVLGTLFVP